METRLIALVTVLSLSVGLVFGFIAGALLTTNGATPDNAVVQLDLPEQDDFIITAAEAYAGDHDMQLAQDRLARLHSENIAARVEILASEYASQRDLIAMHLAGLAVALGSENTTLIAMNVVAEPTVVAQQAAPAKLPAAANTGAPTSIPAALQPTQAPSPSPSAPASPPSSKGNIDGPVTPTPAPEPTAPLSPPPAVGGNGGESATTTAPTAPLSPPPSVGGNGGGSATTTAPTGVAASPDVQRAPAPTATPKRVAANAQPNQPTRAPASNPKPNNPKQPISGSSRVVSTIAVSLPDYVGAPALSIPLNAPPSNCTPASQLPSVVDHTMALCANQEYPPFRVKGNNITIYGDPGGSARVHAPGRAFGITVNGSNITITGVHIEADTDPADLNTWLCLYENCNFKGSQVHGASGYGGGILLDHTTNVAVVSSTVSRGAIGVASVHGSNNKIVNNNLSNLNGWGAFLFFTDNSAVVGNTLNHVTRSCMGPDGASFTTGCESAGIAAIRARTNLFVNNHCEHSSNCIYASGEGGYSSNDNKFFNNYCAASPHNCYEITFSSGNRFDYNVATSDPNTGDQCTYPFWISGSSVYFGQHNTWNCKYSAERAFADSQHATTESTAAHGF